MVVILFSQFFIVDLEYKILLAKIGTPMVKNLV